ncbi:MAG TPA: MFS transporter [Nitrososphaerales archaeon]|nr:MFS transporter [Nitrososphaerales archaeon]
MQTGSDVSERLDKASVSWFHRRLLVVCGFGYFFDLMDLQIIAAAIPAIAAAWKLTSVESGIILSTSYLGLFIGSLGAGVLADYLGRKKVFQITLLLFALLTGLAALSQNVVELVAFRFLIGLGLGGELPVVASLVSEFIPKDARGRYLSFLNGFNAFGALAAAFIGVAVVPYKFGAVSGWQISFLIGAVPALYIWFVRRGIPESPRWLKSRGMMAEAEQVLAKVTGSSATPTADSGGSSTPSEARKESPFRRLFDRDVARTTLLCFVSWFCLSWVFYGILVWLPSLLVSQGFTLLHSLQVNLYLNLWGIPGFLASALLIERVGRKKLLVGFIALSAVSIFVWGHSNTTLELLGVGALTYFATAGMMTANASYTAELFPTPARGTGLGASQGLGRISAYVGITSVGFLLGSIGVSGLYTIYTLLLVVPIIAVAALGKESRGKSLEAIAA